MFALFVAAQMEPHLVQVNRVEANRLGGLAIAADLNCRKPTQKTVLTSEVIPNGFVLIGTCFLAGGTT